jgi:hydroxyacyl-ACP dehydratase HTD2-like protein with hotdog domain
MSRTLRRLYSSASSPSATSVAAQFLSKTQSQPPLIQTQLLDANQLQRFSATLSRTELSNSLPEKGTPLPACFHLAYFTPSQVEEELGKDGTDTTFNPPSPFTRRMWAGGELEWIAGEGKGLCVGQEVRETTKLVSSVGKKTKAGEELVVVGVEKRFENEHGVALIDKR